MNKPLAGLCILNTRPEEQGKNLSDAIISAGGTVITCPMIAIEPLSGDWVHKLPALSTIDKAIFISPNAVSHCFRALAQAQILWPKEIEVYAIGTATASKLAEYDILSVQIPEQADSQHLLLLPTLQNIRGQNILLFKGLGGLTLIEDGLKKRQAKVQVFPLYRRILPKYDPAFIQSIWQKNTETIILITSETALVHLFQVFKEEQAINWLCSKPYVLLSERLAQVAKKMGIVETHISSNDTIMETLITLSRTRV